MEGIMPDEARVAHEAAVAAPRVWTRSKNPSFLTATYKTTFDQPIKITAAHDYTDEPAVAAERWYDPSTRSWVIMLVDEHGYQIGTADYYPGRQPLVEADKIVGVLIERYREKNP